MNYDRSTVKLPQHILQYLHVTLPLCKMIGIPKGEASKLSKEMAPTQVPINPLSALVHFRGSTQIASQTKITDFEDVIKGKTLDENHPNSKIHLGSYKADNRRINAMLLHPQTVSHRTGVYVSSNDDAPHSRVITRKWEEERGRISFL